MGNAWLFRGTHRVRGRKRIIHFDDVLKTPTLVTRARNRARELRPSRSGGRGLQA